MLYSAINQEHHEKLDRILPKVKNTLSRYFIGLLLQVSIITVMVATGLSIVGIENIFFIAIFAGLINVIPYVGPLIGSSVGLILATAQNLNLPFEAELMPLIGMVALVFLITQMIDNLVITAAGTLLGVMGMIVAVPFYSLLRIIAKEFLSEFHIIQSLTRNV
jgi:predicted PurR-regulated permease PerM